MGKHRCGYGRSSDGETFTMFANGPEYFILPDDRRRLITENIEVDLWQTHPRKNWEIGYPDSKYPPKMIGSVKLSADKKECFALIPHETRRISWDKMTMIKTFLDVENVCPIYELY